MNTARAKLYSWSAAGILAVGLSVYVLDFVRRKQEMRQMVDPAQIANVLKNIQKDERKNDDAIQYADVKRGWIDLQWMGKPPPKPAVVLEDDGPQSSAGPQPMEKLVKVLAMQADTSAPQDSKCVIKYLPESRVQLLKGPAQVRQVGEWLEAPLDYVQVAAIDELGVEFAFLDEARAKERMEVQAFDVGGRIVQVGEDGVKLPEPGSSIPRGKGYTLSPKETQRMGPNTYRVGIDDAQYINENFDKILATELRLEPNRDPKTGKRDGIRIRDVKSGSLAEKHGAQDGDVIKAINGHPVSSTQDAVNFVKNNADVYDKWELLVENRGIERTVVYYPPGKD